MYRWSPELAFPRSAGFRPLVTPSLQSSPSNSRTISRRKGEVGIEGSNPLRSTPQSPRFRTSRRIARNPRVCARFRARTRRISLSAKIGRIWRNLSGGDLLGPRIIAFDSAYTGVVTAPNTLRYVFTAPFPRPAGSKSFGTTPARAHRDERSGRSLRWWEASWTPYLAAQRGRSRDRGFHHHSA
jgi:hypothetical protein